MEKNQKAQNMDGNPLVSVIMNCYNSEKYVKEAIESVCAQTYENWEIIFWDNASTDGSSKIAQEFAPKLKYYRGDHNVPLGEARNFALEKAQGKFIAFLDCDDLWMPQKLEKQIPLFLDPEVGLVYSDAIYFNLEGDSHRLYQSRRFYTGQCFAQLLTDYFLCMQTVIIRKEALSTLADWFDTEFNLIEEVDLFTRIGYSWKLAMANEPLAKWRVHSSSSTWKYGTQFADEFNVMLQKFEKVIPKFASEYTREMLIVKRQNAIGKAMFMWRDGKRQDARRIVRPLLKQTPKAWLVFCATFFPEHLVRRLLTPLRKTKISPSST